MRILKAFNYSFSYFCIGALFCFNISQAAAQDSLTVEQLRPLTFPFTIEDGKLKGAGADFLMKEFEDAQFTMLGEYHGSKRISEFTKAIIPILHQYDYKTMVLEVGPVTGDYLNSLKGDITGALKATNEKYMIVEEDGYVNSPIPFFESIEDASFLEQAKDLDWNIIGIDQEFYNGFEMLVDRMYEKLNSTDQEKFKGSYATVKDSLRSLYLRDIKGEIDYAVEVNGSSEINDFLDVMSENEAIKELVNAFKASIHIYSLYAQKKWYENNSTRIKYMKVQLRKGLERIDFDLSQDKLLIKMGGYHLAKGFSPLALYEVGSTLNEIAEFHGNSALNIGFSMRYYMADDELIDGLDNDNENALRLKDLDQMGQKDKWVVIDLRPLVSGHFYYPQKYRYNKYVKELVQRYDLLVIPAVDKDPTPNYQISK